VITYPAINGDIKVVKEHNTYNKEMSNRRGWGDGEPYTKIRKSAMDIYLEAKDNIRNSRQQERVLNYNKETKRGMQGDAEEMREEDS